MTYNHIIKEETINGSKSFISAIFSTLTLTYAIFAGAASVEPDPEDLKAGGENYLRFCSTCHGKSGEGKDGTALAGSAIATGPIGAHIEYILKGGKHSEMPSWGLTALSDKAIAQIIMYTRHSWGNNDQSKYGKSAGGLVTPDLIREYREVLEKQTTSDNIRL